ncbi:CPCC family cysteine-rich protein [Phytobacter diazotrophicus]|uniref:CPCC family cysteine-rich protein n=2 Tax=Phytobacter diazotrophicus TaxID=395631 RepID=UPI002FFC01D4
MTCRTIQSHAIADAPDIFCMELAIRRADGKISTTRDSGKMKENKHSTCLCCGKRTLEERGSYEICAVCGWEDDPVQSADPDFAGGANSLSLHACRLAWAAVQRNKPT